ncbi:hypothetical protein [Glaciecola petra]|uniref:Uncharacterized protein n=1 Tax=Glaciecola petra TaxID=3075602 RepID=A0ABU2ZL73_9ALTE|nr:hypothetical protein [Aestuariibacter sp. P117]MDT0593367.1 hypothetical protein [Aestuariibacter sp. P117]
MRRFIKRVLIACFILLLLFTVLIIEFSPSVNVDASKQVNNADQIQALLSDLRTSLRSRYDAQTIDVSDLQAESLAGFLQRAKQQARAEILFKDNILMVNLSYQLDALLFPVFINIESEITEGSGVNINTVKVGKLRLPGSWSLSIMEYVANAYTNSLVATKAIASVEKLTISSTGMRVHLTPLDSLLREFKNIQTGGDDEESILLKIKIAHYLRLLDGLSINATENSLDIYIQALMQEAYVLSENGSATLENEAAILALAIYAGSRRIATFTGDLSFALDRLPYARVKPVLVNRQDLSLHFVFSAAIKLMSEKGISIAVGEFKELMDRGAGGSGYSFIDLAADMSGAHFAAMAVDPKTAVQVQQALRHKKNEALFMVDVTGFEEGMTKAEFELKYSKVDSPEYLAVVSEIERRLSGLALSK